MHHTHHCGAAAPGLAAPERAVLPAGLAPLGTAGAARSGLSPPQKDERPELAGGGAFREQGRENTPDCADITAECKRLATLRARLARAGWVLTADLAGTFTAARWGMARELRDLAAVAAFAAQVGAPS